MGARKPASKTDNVLILGGAGFLGANLVRFCLKQPKVKLTVVDFLDPRLKSFKENLKDVLAKIKFIKGDIRNADFLRKVVPGQRVIFNCAAQTSHSLSLNDPIFDADVNCIGTLQLLQAVKNYNPEAVVIYTSSSTVLGKTLSDLADENHVERPLDIYSANKSVAEKYHRIFRNVHGLKTVCLRFANLYGPFGKGSPDYGFVNYFISQAARGKPITIYGDGAQTRNLMFVDDAIEAMWSAIDNPRLYGETFFATHHEHHSIKDVAEAIVEVFGRGKVEYISWPDFKKRIEVGHVLLSSARFHYLTNWRPKYSLKDGLRLTRLRMLGGK